MLITVAMSVLWFVVGFGIAFQMRDILVRAANRADKAVAENRSFKNIFREIWNEEQATQTTPVEAEFVPHTLADLAALPPVVYIPTHIPELDKALGGGFVPGSVVLLESEAGVGSSTLVLQALAGAGTAGRPVLYCSTDMSLTQTGDYVRRLKLVNEHVFVDGPDENDCVSCQEDITDMAETLGAVIVVIDDINNLPVDNDSQMLDSARRLTKWAKTENICLVILHHVVKAAEEEDILDSTIEGLRAIADIELDLSTCSVDDFDVDFNSDKDELENLANIRRLSIVRSRYSKLGHEDLLLTSEGFKSVDKKDPE